MSVGKREKQQWGRTWTSGRVHMSDIIYELWRGRLWKIDKGQTADQKSPQDLTWQKKENQCLPVSPSFWRHDVFKWSNSSALWECLMMFNCCWLLRRIRRIQWCRWAGSITWLLLWLGHGQMDGVLDVWTDSLGGHMLQKPPLSVPWSKYDQS